MNLLMFLRGRGSAPVARERLQILLAHERTSLRSNDLLGTIREEILAVIARHVTLDPAKVQVKMDRGGMSLRWKWTLRFRMTPVLLSRR